MLYSLPYHRYYTQPFTSGAAHHIIVFYNIFHRYLYYDCLENVIKEDKMKIRLGSGLLFLNILAIILVLIIIFVPATWVRAFIGLPFILFTPGYALITALFPRKSSMDAIERLALSIGLSFAAVALLGLGLNYTSWGITLWSSIIASGSFIIVSTIIAEYRRWRLPSEERFSIDINLTNISLGENKLSRTLSVILILSILGTIGTLAYTIASPKVGERFTEFYILGQEGEAAGYPQNFILSNGVVTSVDYGDDNIVQDSTGKLTIGIINREQQDTTYTVKIQFDGKATGILVDGNDVAQLGPVTLQNDEEYEIEIGFAPTHTGDNQRVDIILLVDGKPYFDDPLHIWINVTEE
jgi:uncharacterized membrane protein